MQGWRWCARRLAKIIAGHFGPDAGECEGEHAKSDRRQGCAHGRATIYLVAIFM
jgi:hypothetical protein